MHTIELLISPEGDITCIKTDAAERAGLLTLGQVETRRASHVEPQQSLLRLAFHLLRRIGGESGRLASFTRRWPCRWRIDMRPSGGPVLTETYTDRAAALAAEVAWLRANVFQFDQPEVIE